MKSTKEVEETNKLSPNKIRGAIVGGAYGDARGVPYEFHSTAAWVELPYTTDISPTALTAFAKKHDPPYQLVSSVHRSKCPENRGTFERGQVSDDTEMAIALSTALLRTKILSKTPSDFGVRVRPFLIEEYIKWANSKGNVCMGRRTRALFKGVSTITGFEKRLEKLEETDEAQPPLSNGCLMRAYPLAFISDPDVRRRVCYVDTQLTNNHEIAIYCVRVYVEAVHMALQVLQAPQTPTTIKEIVTHAEEMVKKYNQPELTKAFNQAISHSARDIETNRGYCLHAFYCAFYCLTKFTAGDINECFTWIITTPGMKKCDTDTCCAIAGALYGAYYGYDQMKVGAGARGVLDLQCLESCTTQDGTLPRPAIYTLPHFIDMIPNLQNL